jgi:hypothetical protein
MSRALLIRIQGPYLWTWDRDLVAITNMSRSILKYYVYLDENKDHIILKIMAYLKKILGNLTLLYTV